MLANNPLGGILTTLLERRPFGRRPEDGAKIIENCQTLLAKKTDGSGLHVATSILNQYHLLDDDQKIAFFTYLNDELDLDADALVELAKGYAAEPSAVNFRALSKGSTTTRQKLFWRLNGAEGATSEIVKMRKDLLAFRKAMPELGRTDHDLVQLLRTWFNRGFLVMRQITWDSPASILEKIIAYEAVHQIQTWDDLRRRLHPKDRRLFAFFHPSMPDEPLIFVEVALTKGIPNSIQTVLSDTREPIEAEDADTAVFYSISNCQPGLAGISFGNSLIKQVARDLAMELPNIKTFVTLSPIPGLTRWMGKIGVTPSADDPELLAKLAAKYLLEAKKADGQPLDPVSRFHLGNGAMVHAVHPGADISDNGMAQSAGVMVNYLYDLNRIPQNVVTFSETQEVIATAALKSLAKKVAA